MEKRSLINIENDLIEMGITNTWIMEHLRISSLEEKQKERRSYPKTEQYEQFKRLTNSTALKNPGAFYNKMEDLIDEKIKHLLENVN